MRWQFWHQPVPQKLSDVVQKTLLSQFPLDSPLAERIRCLGRNGRYSGRPSHYIRIFDPTLVGDQATSAPIYDDFSENHEHRGALLFEGRTEKVYDNLQVFITDRRIA
ncbi:MAG: hypothetical protein O2860_09650 [Chloroflexi bacterium]|nr:hypothetical protein [Chloroflexota bacterium]